MARAANLHWGGLLLAVVLACPPPALAADALPAKAIAAPAGPPSGWQFRFTPYAWLAGLDGSSTVRGRTTDIDASFIDIVQKSSTLFALMAYGEARNGRFSVFADAIYEKVGGGAGFTRSRNVRPEVGGTLGASLGVDFQMAIVEAAAAWEIVRFGGGETFTAIDIYAGGRYWWQQASANFALTGTLTVADLTVSGGIARADSGSVSWIDPLVGARARMHLAPGVDFELLADVGGFGVGSKFSWQGVAALSWEFCRTKNVTWAAVVGYRALYVDYIQGAGITLYEYNMLTHGPLIGVSLRF